VAENVKHTEYLAGGSTVSLVVRNCWAGTFYRL